MIFNTDDNRRVVTWSRQPFVKAGWIDKDDWLDKNELTLQTPIPVTLTADGDYWKIATVEDRGHDA